MEHNGDTNFAAGGFKSMKSRWLKTFEREQREREEAERAAKLASEQQAALQPEKVADALKDGPSADHPPTDGKGSFAAERSEANAKPLQSKQSAQGYERNPDPVPSSAPDPDLPTAVSASDPVAVAQQELALEAEANAIAELADSASEGKRELGTSRLADVVVDSPPARRAPGKCACTLGVHHAHIHCMCPKIERLLVVIPACCDPVCKTCRHAWLFILQSHVLSPRRPCSQGIVMQASRLVCISLFCRCAAPWELGRSTQPRVCTEDAVRGAGWPG